MADWYCDPSKPSSGDYSATPVAGGTVPTKSEDGNGKGTGTAAMATLVITFSGIPAAAGTITIAGVTFTAVASGATGNQFNAVTSAAQCATNLAAAINASSTNVVNPTMIVACPLRNAVNATASAGVVTVYTRISGTEWNSVTETESLTNAVITTQWAGGTDGAWGYFFNPSSIAWPNAVSAGTYGAFPGCYLGSVAAGDTIHHRTKRSGSNITITWPASGLTVQARNIGTSAAPLTHLADNGIKWSGDNGVLIMSMDSSVAGTRQFIMNNTAGAKQVWSGVPLTATTRNWRWEMTGVHLAGSYYTYIGGQAAVNGTYLEMQYMEFTGASGGVMNNGDNNHCVLRFECFSSSVFPTAVPRTIFRGLIVKNKSRYAPILADGSSYSISGYFENCVFDFTGITSPATQAVVQPVNASGSLEFVGCKWLGLTAASNLSGMQNMIYYRPFLLVMRDCYTPNLRYTGGTAGGGILGTLDYLDGFSHLKGAIHAVSTIGNQNMVYETSRMSFAWIDSAAPKTASALLPDGVTAFSIRAAVTAESGIVSKGLPVIFPPMVKFNSLTDGTRTATLRLLVDNNIRTTLGSRDPKNDEMWINVTYVNTSGEATIVTSKCQPGATAASIPGGTSGDWSATSYDINGSPHNYTAFAISVSCPDMKAGCTASLEFCTGVQTSSVDNLCFLDGEWGLA